MQAGSLYWNWSLLEPDTHFFWPRSNRGDIYTHSEVTTPAQWLRRTESRIQEVGHLDLERFLCPEKQSRGDPQLRGGPSVQEVSRPPGFPYSALSPCWGQNKMNPTSQSYRWSFLGVSGNKGTGEIREERKAFWKGLWRLCRSLPDQVKKLVSTFWTFLRIYLYSTYWKHYGILHAIHSSPSGSRNFIHRITVFYPPSSYQTVLLLSRCITSHTHTYTHHVLFCIFPQDKIYFLHKPHI